MTQCRINAGTQEGGSERRSPLSFAAPSHSRTLALSHACSIARSLTISLTKNRQLRTQIFFMQRQIFGENVSVEICLKKIQNILRLGQIVRVVLYQRKAMGLSSRRVQPTSLPAAVKEIGDNRKALMLHLFEHIT